MEKKRKEKKKEKISKYIHCISYSTLLRCHLFGVSEIVCSSSSSFFLYNEIILKCQVEIVIFYLMFSKLTVILCSIFYATYNLLLDHRIYINYIYICSLFYINTFYVFFSLNAHIFHFRFHYFMIISTIQVEIFVRHFSQLKYIHTHTHTKCDIFTQSSALKFISKNQFCVHQFSSLVILIKIIYTKKAMPGIEIHLSTTNTYNK